VKLAFMATLDKKYLNRKQLSLIVIFHNILTISKHINVFLNIHLYESMLFSIPSCFSIHSNRKIHLNCDISQHFNYF